MSARKRSRISRLSYIILFALIIVSVLVFLLQRKLNSFASELCEYRSREVLNRVITEAVNDALSHDTDELYSIKFSNSGDIISYGADQLAVNRLKNEITEKINTGISNLGEEEVTITLGDMIGTEFLSNKGIAFSVEYVPNAAVSTDIEQSFEAAGINQTRVISSLRITVDIAAVFPFGSRDIKIENEYILADEVIVGEVPAFFSQK
ncbi:MAG: sporulation protein YunB [Ruminococcus sp.]|nr:sporulation protein YunB [Ruminococcus sp.]